MTALTLWTVYHSPKDYPGQYVARKFEVDRPTDQVVTGDTLASVREQLPRGLMRFARAPQDDPVIVEVWL